MVKYCITQILFKVMVMHYVSIAYTLLNTNHIMIFFFGEGEGVECHLDPPPPKKKNLKKNNWDILRPLSYYCLLLQR